MIDYMLRYKVESFSVIVKLFPIIAIWYMMAHRREVTRWMFWYLIFELCIGLVMLWLGSRRMNNLLFYNISVYVGYGFLAMMFYEGLNFKVDKWLVVGLTIIFYAVATADFIDVGTERSLKFTGTLECLILLLFIFRVCWEIIKELKVTNLLRYHFFWICSGLLMYASSKTFIAPLYYYIDVWNGPTGFDVHLLLPSIFEVVYLLLVGFGALASKQYI